MIYLVRGPPRVGKTTLATIALAEAGIAWCSTDMLVGMLERAAPDLGVRHGFGVQKSASMAAFLRPFLLCAEMVNDDYLVEGDVITPSFATSIRPRLKAVRSVFMGNTKLSETALRLEPDWLADYDAAAYEHVRLEIIAASKRLRHECSQTGHIYIEMGDGWDAGLQAAADALRFARDPIG